MIIGNLKANLVMCPADMGAEALYEILRKMDLEKLSRELWREVRTTRSKQAAKRATKRYRLLKHFAKAVIVQNG